MTDENVQTTEEVKTEVAPAEETKTEEVATTETASNEAEPEKAPSEPTAQEIKEAEAKAMMQKIYDTVEAVCAVISEKGLTYAEAQLIPVELQKVVQGIKFDTEEFKQLQEIENTLYGKLFSEIFKSFKVEASPEVVPESV